MVARLSATASAPATVHITANHRGSRQRCKSLTSGASRTLSRTARAMGTRISQVKYRAATTIARMTKFVNARPAGTTKFDHLLVLLARPHHPIGSLLIGSGGE